MSYKKFVQTCVALVFVGAFFIGLPNTNKLQAKEAAVLPTNWVYNFWLPSTLEEAGSDDTTTSPYWWVNSGAYLKMEERRGFTNVGELPSDNYWRKLYGQNNPVDTDNGYHPQNIFRLVTRAKWQDASEQVYFKILKDNLSESPNRNQSNGLLLFNRYQDGYNLYYTGVRVDGTVVIKKKINGRYYTMAQEKIYPGTWNHDSSPNLLPHNKWIGLRSEVTNLPGGKVGIKVYLDPNWNNRWTLALEAVDDGVSYGGPAFTQPGFGGIRTDFMDVMFDQFEFHAM